MNRIGSVILFDVGCRKLCLDEDGFFPRSKRCLVRLILRKMFSEDSDELAILLFGSDKTNNYLAEQNEEKYSNIEELYGFGKPSFATIELVEKLTQCKGYVSDWVVPMIVALEYLRRGSQGKKYKMKQIVIISEFKSKLDYNENMLHTISNLMNQDKVKLCVFGPEIDTDSDDQPVSLQPLLNLFKKLDDPLIVSLDELEDSIKYFEKKRKTRRVYNVDLEIGSKIKIPVGWIKVTSESQRFTNWVNKTSLDTERVEESMDIEASSQSVLEKLDADTGSLRSIDPQDVINIAMFGDTKVKFSSADMESIKRKSGPPSFKIFMFAPCSFINPTVHVGEDIYAVIPKDKSKFSQCKLYALIDAMKEKKRIGIARRIVTNNGKVQLGCLIPFSDESGKHLYYLRLPTAEWAQLFPRYRPPLQYDIKMKAKIGRFIDMLRLPEELVDEGKGVLVPDPNFQHRCQVISDRAMDPSCDITTPKPYIKNIIDPCPSIKENKEAISNEILCVFPWLDKEYRKKQLELKRAQKRFKQEGGVKSESTGDRATAENVDSMATGVGDNPQPENTEPPNQSNEIKYEALDMKDFDLSDPDQKEFVDYLEKFVEEYEIKVETHSMSDQTELAGS